MKNILLLIVILFLGITSAANIQYTINQRDVLVEIDLNQEEIDIFEFPEDFEYINNKVTYIDKNLIEKSGSEFFFVAKSELHPFSNIKVILPEGSYFNDEYFAFPRNYLLSTDGKNIVIEWKNNSEREILVPYKINSKNYLFEILFVILILGIIFYLNKRQKEKIYTQNLFREEKQIINYLMKKKESWTKEIVRDLNISKVRLSRKLRKLEEKGLIEKIPFGNENKIRLKK